MKIEVFGTGCPKCNALEGAAREAAEGLGIDYELIKVSDIAEMASRGVLLTPALAVDGVIRISGKVPSVEKIRGMLQD
ncbi:MAG: TM0996/MTH895 family glutaredoxin-like protein [Candidatus Eisenbacteria bacterium]|nr:TM0996/MTH895 family glutaredoxin-like protein [Candidatus Eisenbacteria bacterium]